jgi:LPS-assembly protein
VIRLLLLLLIVVLGRASAAVAQETPAPLPAERLKIGDFELSGDTIQTISDEQGSPVQLHVEGNASLPIGRDTKVFADVIDLFLESKRLVASGNVALQNAEGVISAAKIEFDLATGTGTFYDASGVMSLGARADRTQFGDQDPDVYFKGEKIERLGPRRYRITRGQFTTCVQPEPRWQIVSRSIEINLDDYAIARNTMLKVKGVPLLFLPIIYYPIQEGDRATGILLPAYGSSRLRGQTVSNGFFWAIGRSHDATFAHDWFTKAGQGIGAEYRYVANVLSSGEARVRRFYQKEASYTTDGVTRTIPASTSFELTGQAVQTITPTIRARARIDYASDIISQQLYQQSLYRASNPMRAIEGGLSGSWGAFNANASYQRTEVFTSEDRSVTYGSTPRINAAVAPQQLFGLPIYGSVNSEYAYLPYRDVIKGVVLSDKTLSRLDINPTIRVPLSGLTYLTVNSSAAFRTTYYSRSSDERGNMLPEPLTRTYLSLRSDIVGPVFNKIWDTPDSLTTERRKHVIEPSLSIDYVSPLETFTRVPVLSDYSDIVVGSTTSMTYGLTNRLFARGRSLEGGRGTAREVLTIGVQQTYYSNPDAGKFDSNYQSAYGYLRPLDLSPIAISARMSPVAALDTNGRLEYDVSGKGLQLMSAGGGAQGEHGSVNVNYSWRHIDKKEKADNYLSTSGTARGKNGRASATYSLSWDIGRGYVVSQTMLASYMAQCCGFQVEYQQFNYVEKIGLPLPSDRRMNFGFTLAGLGTFSNFLGAFGGGQ